MQADRQGIGAGVLLIVVGLLFMADHQGWASFARLWPLLLVAAGLNMLVFGQDRCDLEPNDPRRERRLLARRRSRTSSGIWMIFVGGLLFANQNHWMSFRDSWPLFIVAGGLAMIVGNIRRTPAAPTSTDGTSGQHDREGVGGASWR